MELRRQGNKHRKSIKYCSNGWNFQQATRTLCCIIARPFSLCFSPSLAHRIASLLWVASAAVAANMSIETKDVANIAHLARLAIAVEDMPAYADNLSKIFSFVEQLNAADVARTEPMAHPLAGQVQRLRDDEVTESDAHEKFQRNAPSVEASLYLVPKVIE